MFRSVKGGHVIIEEGYSPDKYDTALANFISSFFPGRAEKIKPRDDLANPWRAAQRGYSYRLLENGFITNSGDLNKFNGQMDDLARGILNAFGIATASPAKEDSDGKVTSGGTSQDSVQHYGKVSYQSHIRDIGWACWQSDGRMSGTTGQNRRIEAFRLIPVGETDVVVHIKDVGDKEYKNISKGTTLAPQDRTSVSKQSRLPARIRRTSTESTRKTSGGQIGHSTEIGLEQKEKGCKLKRLRLWLLNSLSIHTSRTEAG